MTRRRRRLALEGGHMNGTTDRRPTGSVRGLTCDGARASLGHQLTLAIAIFSLLSTSCTPLEGKPPGGVSRIEQLESALAAAQKDLAGLQSERSELQRRYEAAVKERDELLAAQAKITQAAVERVSQLQRNLKKPKEKQHPLRASLKKPRRGRETAQALPRHFQVI